MYDSKFNYFALLYFLKVLRNGVPILIVMTLNVDVYISYTIYSSKYLLL